MVNTCKSSSITHLGIFLFLGVLGVLTIAILSAQMVSAQTQTIYMQDTKATHGLSAYSGRQIQAEYVSSSSVLVGKHIDTITVQIKKSGAPTGSAIIGVFNTDLSVKKSFGTIDASTLTTSYQNYTFSLNSFSLNSFLPYQIQSGDRIGIKYTGGDASTNYIAIMTDQSNTFDDKNSYHTYYTTTWQNYPTADLYMTLEETNALTPTPTLSASPPGGTYKSILSVKLTASEPATIHYTKDGSTPTTSSAIYSSPISIRTTTTLKFFAQDSNGNSGSIVTEVYTIYTTPPSSSDTDKFGIQMLYPTLSGGMEWYSKWDNGIARSWGYAKDPSDSWFSSSHGSATFSTTGDGILKISGSTPRMYVQDPQLLNQWKNVEVTMYFMRVSDSNVAWSGMEAVARSNHGTTNQPETSYLCDTRGIDARMRDDGHIDFEKETSHPNSVTVSNKPMWSGGLPQNTWIGYKLVVYDLPDGNVKLQLWMDATDGLNGGTWIKLNEFIDTGSNFGVGGTSCKQGMDPAMKLTNAPARDGSESGKPNISTYFRADGINTNGLLYKDGSIREILPPSS
jgi:hypothetical protein